MLVVRRMVGAPALHNINTETQACLGSQDHEAPTVIQFPSLLGLLGSVSLGGYEINGENRAEACLRDGSKDNTIASSEGALFYLSALMYTRCLKRIPGNFS
jgi:hypothetical protein